LTPDGQTCDRCGGTGWVMVKRDEREVAQRCLCQENDIYLAKAEYANIPKRFLGAELEWGYQPGHATQKTAKKAAQKFIDDYPAVEKGLLFQGEAGVGKTTLLCAIGFELIKKKDVDVYYIDWNELIREMRSGEHRLTKDFSTINQLIWNLAAVELLLFDELGASDIDKLTPWVYENIYYIFNKRYNNNKITLCATNYSDVEDNPPEDMLFSKRVGQLIRSRLYEMTDIIKLQGGDFRRKNLSGNIKERR